MPDLQYRDPADGLYKPVGPGAVGPTGLPGPMGPTGPVGVLAPDIGAIMMYGGSTAPVGWHLCDGTAHGSAALEALLGSPNTPDLRDKFVMGAGNLYAAKSTGGAATVTLTAAQSGRVGHTHAASRAHTHSADPPNTNSVESLGNHQHTAASNAFALTTGSALTADGDGSTYYYIYGYASPTTKKNLAHTHTFDVANYTCVATAPTLTIASVAAANATAAHENLPPFYTLTYIVRTA